jgi:hypothetical protein
MNCPSTNKLALIAFMALTINHTAPVFAQESTPDALPEVVDADALPDGEVGSEDSDNDGFPDVTEDQEGTDPFDPQDTPIIRMVEEQEGEFQTKAAVPADRCHQTNDNHFRQIGNELCISRNPISARRFDVAMVTCQNLKARVATYGDLSFIFLTSTLDGQYNPNGRYIGPDLVSDDRVLIGNRPITGNNDPDASNFEGTDSKLKPREFWCAHDLTI